MDDHDFTDEVLEMLDMRENVPTELPQMIEIEYTNNYPTVMYGEDAGAFVYYRICPYCGRFVKADDSSKGPGCGTNATCKKHGRVEMPFLDYAGELGWDPSEEDQEII